jgi:hypothetical protein
MRQQLSQSTGGNADQVGFKQRRHAFLWNALAVVAGRAPYTKTVNLFGSMRLAMASNPSAMHGRAQPHA